MMYGIGSNYYNYSQLYSSMFGRPNSFGFQSCNSCNPWNSMVPNYAQLNDRLLGITMSNNYSRLKSQMEEIAIYEQGSKEFYSEFQPAFTELKTASSALKSYSGDSVFRPTGYASSNTDVAAVTENTAAVTGPINLEVTQTAAATSYASKALDSTGFSLNGQHMLNITDSDGNITSINVEFSSAEDNKANLNRLAAALNERDLGITASVSEADGKSTLVFSSSKTGTDNAFTAELTGESAISVRLEEKQQARNARYTVNGGEEQVSQSNEIRLVDGNLGITLKGPGRTEITRRTVDDTQTVEAVKNFADKYNKVLNFLNKYKGLSTSMSDLAYYFGNTRLQAGRLSSIGIDVDSKGALSVDEGRLKSALRSNREDVEKILGGTGGLASYAYTKTSVTLQTSRNLYPKPPSLSCSSYMYGRNRNYVTPHMSGLFFSYLA